jgi:hypothetical protein
VYTYLKTEIGPSFKIPLHKLSALKIEDNTAELTFLNGDNTIDTQKLKKIDQNGITLLNNLNIQNS